MIDNYSINKDGLIFQIEKEGFTYDKQNILTVCLKKI